VTAALFVEALDTAITLGWALLGWLIFFATVAAILTLAAIATGAWGVRTAWRRVARPSWARSRFRARIFARTRTRRPNGRTRPRWVHSQPLDYEEAA